MYFQVQSRIICVSKCLLSMFLKIVSLESCFKEHTRDVVLHCGDSANKLCFIPVCANFKLTFLFILLLVQKAVKLFFPTLNVTQIFNREFISLEDRARADFLGCSINNS